MRKFFFALGIVFLCVAVLFLAFFRSGQFWDGTSRFRLIFGGSSGIVSYVLVDPKRSEIRVFPLNQDTQIEASYGLGKWKIASLWKLGMQENRGGGELLSKSLIRGYGLPVEGYLHYETEVEPFSLARTLLISRDTNLYLRDRLTLAWYVLHAHISTENTLSPQSIILTAEELTAVTDGIVTISNTQSLTDAQSKAVSVLVSNLGGKVLDFSTLTSNQDQFCSVSGKSTFAQKLSHILGCSFSQTNEETTTLNLGEAFAKNF